MTSFRCLVLGPERLEEASLIELKVVSLNFAGCNKTLYEEYDFQQFFKYSVKLVISSKILYEIH